LQQSPTSTTDIIFVSIPVLRLLSNCLIIFVLWPEPVCIK